MFSSHDDDVRKDYKAQEHSNGAIAGVSFAMIVVALTSMALAF